MAQILAKTLVGPLPTTEQWLFKLEGRGGGREANFEKAEFGSWCMFNRIRTHELEAENSQPSSLNSQPAGRLARRQWQEGREVTHLEPGLQERPWKLFPCRRALCGLRASICPLTYSLSMVPSDALSLFDLAQVGSPTAPASPRKEELTSAYSVGEWAQLASKVYSEVPLHPGFG